MQIKVLLTVFAVVLACARPTEASEAAERALEAALLNRHLPLDHVASFVRARRTWEPLRDSTATVRVVNLWARTCLPCLAEMPELRALADQWKRRNSRAVQFLFVADPPELTSAEDVVAFWTSPYADGLARECPPNPPGTDLGGKQMLHKGILSCLLNLPQEDPARSETKDILRALSGAEVRPLTLLLDEQGTIRQVFVGSLRGKGGVVTEAIERLLAAPSLTKRRLSGR